MKIFFLITGWLLAGLSPGLRGYCRPPVRIIPQPVSLVEKEGEFLIGKNTRILADTKNRELCEVAQQFAAAFQAASGIALPLQDISNKGEGKNTLVLRIQTLSNRNKEAYELAVQPDKIEIAANQVNGLFYALQSLQQLLPVDFFSNGNKKSVRWKIPCVIIQDHPAFVYRGMHLDVSRHFFPVSFIRKYLDLLALYKINTFHWHLTDSHGWRLQIKQYPRLTTIGAWRADRQGIPMTIASPTQKNEAATYGGFYTQEEVKEIIEYARKRFITIIPEIEMPGHCTAALLAYPQYTCLNNKVPLLMPCGYEGDLRHNFCVGNDSTFIFLQNILTEVMELFPSEYIHIGGDEVKPESWLNCPRCRQRMQKEHLATGKALQAYFTKRIDDFITSKNRKLIGWDEIMEAGISPNAAVMSWRGNEGGIRAARSGHDVVMAPYRYVYFDFYQSDPALEPDITYAGLYLNTVYSFDPMPQELTPEERKHILGAQACLWTENVETPGRVEYMLLPRMLALAEVLWTPADKKDYSRFVEKVEEQFNVFRYRKINFAKSLYNVSVRPEANNDSRSVMVSLTDQVAGKYPVYYTIDGSSPGMHSIKYTGPFAIHQSTRLRTALMDNRKLLGEINEDTFTIHKAIGSALSVLPATAGQEALAAYRKLTDGIYGTVEPYDGRWVFFRDSVVTITIDLGTVKQVNSVHLRFLEDKTGNAFLPLKLAVSLSADGKSYKEVYALTNKKIPQQERRHTVAYKKQGIAQQARYVQIKCNAAGMISGNPVEKLLFLDEIVVL